MELIPLDKKYTPRHDQYMRVAWEESLKSTMYQKHGACLVYRNKIVSTGYNYNIHYSHNCFYAIHAEVSAIQNFLKQPWIKQKRIKLRECKIYVVRTGRESMNYPIKFSKPCNNCINFIKKHKIKTESCQ